MKVLIMNGPNLNLLGKREPAVYGREGFASYLEKLKARFPDVEIDYFQSNIEGELVTAIQQADGRYDAVVLNAGAYTHTSVAIADAIGAVDLPVAEVHISCTLARESFRHVSLIPPEFKGAIMGLGLDSYRLGILSVME